jgi:hypothetical protein
VIDIIINGRIRNKAKIYDYVENIARDLNIHRMHSRTIEINIVTKLDNSYGDTWGDGKDADVNIARRRYNKPILYTDMLKTIAHEMVHVKQYMRGELDGYNETWKGKSAARWMKKDWSLHPWEREAIKQEKRLYNKYWKGATK